MGNLYAVGYFNSNDSTGECGLGKWDGTEWVSMHGPEGYNSSVRTLQIHNDDVYAGGSFVHPWDVPSALAKWDGNDWQLIPGLGVSSNEFFLGNISGIEFANDKMYVAGGFTKASDLFVVNVVEWDYVNSEWKKLDDGSPDQGIHDGEIRAMVKEGNSIYAGGSFSVAGGVYARSIAMWDGTGWESLGAGFENGIGGSVFTLLADGENVFAGGYFGSAGSNEAFHIAKWDGTSWSPIGIGVGGVLGAHVRALARMGDYLYVRGYFSVVGDAENFALPANSIARYNLLTNLWEPLGDGIELTSGVPGKVYDMEVYEDKIYIGGEFYNADEMFFENFVVLEQNKFTGIGEIVDIGIEGMVSQLKL
jgi:trimeric autotransporter adhesin